MTVMVAVAVAVMAGAVMVCGRAALIVKQRMKSSNKWGKAMNEFEEKCDTRPKWLRKVADGMTMEMYAGLACENGSKLKMLISYVLTRIFHRMLDWLKALFEWIRWRIPSKAVSRQKGPSWSIPLQDHAFGNVSMGVIQADLTMKHRSVVHCCGNATVVGIYDGENDSSASDHLCTNLIHEVLRIANDKRCITKEVFSSAFESVSNTFVSRWKMMKAPSQAFGQGMSSAIVAVIWNRKIHVANLGDSRVVLGFKENNIIKAVELANEGGEGVGLPPPSVSVSKFAIPPETLSNREGPLLKMEPHVEVREILPLQDCFLIFGTKEFWKHINNYRAVKIVYNNRRNAGIARILAKEALRIAANGPSRTSKLLETLPVGDERRLKIHGEISVIVVFVDYLSLGKEFWRPMTISAPPAEKEVAPCNLDLITIRVD